MFRSSCSTGVYRSFSHMALLLMGAVTALAPSARAGTVTQPVYALTDLGTLPGYRASTANGINDAGQVAGTAELPGERAFLYSNGTLLDIQGAMAGDTRSVGINSSGQIVGNWNQGAFLYSNGTAQVIPDLVAFGINDSGQLVGWAGNHTAVIYSGGALQPVGGIAPPTIATAINSSGQVAVDSEASPGSAYLYSNGNLQPLGGLGGSLTSTWGINDAGEVVGGSSLSAASTNEHAVLFAGGVAHDLGGLEGPGDGSVAFGINDLGQIVGQDFPDNPYGVGFLYENGVMYNLNDLLLSRDGYTIISATGINSSGQIAATAFTPSGTTRAVLLTPTSVPLPSAAWIAIIASPLMLVGRAICRGKIRAACDRA